MSDKTGKGRLPEAVQLLEIQERHNLSEQIFTLRESRGWTQEKLAEESDMTQAQIATLEAGQANPTLRTIVKVAQALDSKVGDLFEPLGDHSSEGKLLLNLPNCSAHPFRGSREVKEAGAWRDFYSNIEREYRSQWTDQGYRGRSEFLSPEYKIVEHMTTIGVPVFNVRSQSKELLEDSDPILQR